MVKKRVLITGGNGYIGSRLSLYLAQEGYAVTPLCFPFTPTDEVWMGAMERIVVGDIRNEKLITELADYGYDLVVHLVSLDHHQSAGSPELVASVNITPTWSLLDAFSKKGLEKFIYFSTMQVYGSLPVGDITEAYKPQPPNAYALTHLIGEQLCEYYNRNSRTQCRIVRLSNSYGAPMFMDNNCWWLVVNDLCRMAMREKKIILLSDGSPQRDFIHGWDICQAVEKIITTNASYNTYHISSGETLTIMEIAQRIQRIYALRYGGTLQIETLAQTKIIDANRKYTIDSSKLKEIGFELKWDLDRGINDLFDFLERNE